ncbi:MAG: thioredoxin family protein, partial [Chitinophagaceae bacterium]|nr:thioredoxin family protein [Chitinophagaceae bacterium]
KIDADQNTALSEQLNITGLPTLLMYKNKKLVWSHMGYIGKDELLEKIITFK